VLAITRLQRGSFGNPAGKTSARDAVTS